jgi:hypothetical protein
MIFSCRQDDKIDCSDVLMFCKVNFCGFAYTYLEYLPIVTAQPSASLEPRKAEFTCITHKLVFMVGLTRIVLYEYINHNFSSRIHLFSSPVNSSPSSPRASYRHHGAHNEKSFSTSPSLLSLKIKPQQTKPNASTFKEKRQGPGYVRTANSGII